MAGIKKINHVAIVVEDIEAALGFWRDSLGIQPDRIQQVPREKSAVAFLPVGDSEIELVQPTSQDTGVAKYLAKRGPGMHHLCLEVEGIETALAGLKGRNIPLINEEAVQGAGGTRYAFIHPKAASGVLVELYELPGEPEQVFPVLETRRLVLREFRLADSRDIFELYARADLVRWLEHEPMAALKEAEERVRARKSLFERQLGCRWAITLKDNPERVIGSCGYFSVRVGTHTVEMGFELHPEFWRQGLMTEALTKIIDYSFSDAGIIPAYRIEALVDPGNQASLALLAKLGFREECLRRSFGFWKGAYRDVKMYALLQEEWLGSG